MDTKDSPKGSHTCENCKKDFEFEIREFTHYDKGHVTCPHCETRQKIGQVDEIKPPDGRQS